MNPVAVRVTGSAVVDGAGPAGKAERVRLAAQKVYVLLAHKEVRVVDWIQAGDRFVVGNGYSRRRLRAERRAARAVETDGESLVTFGVRVIDDGDRERLRNLARGKRHGADGVLVITARRGCAIKDVAVRQAGRVVGGKADAGVAGCVTCASQSDVYARSGLADGIGRRTELDRGCRRYQIISNHI